MSDIDVEDAGAYMDEFQLLLLVRLGLWGTIISEMVATEYQPVGSGSVLSVGML